MFTKSDIRRVSIVIPAGHYNSLIVRLGKEGILHLDCADPGAAQGLSRGVRRSGVPPDKHAAEKIISAAAMFYSERELLPPEFYDYNLLLDDMNSLFARDAAADLRETLRISKALEKYRKSLAAVNSEISSLEEKLNSIRILMERGIDFDELRTMNFASYIYGTVAGEESLHRISRGWFYILHGDKLLVVCPQSERGEALNILMEDGFTEDSGYRNPVTGWSSGVAEIEARLLMLKARALRLDSLFESGEDNRGERLAFLAAVYSLLFRISDAESNMNSTEEIVLVNGWMNFRDAGYAERLLSETCGVSYYMRIATAAENRKYRGRIPVLLKNIPLFKPFELLVRMMGTPGNIEIDPTPAAAIAYTLIFGVMFGDLGQGLILAAAGLFLMRYGSLKHGPGSGVSDFGGIMIWCGISAAIFGLLYGSVFSSEHIIPPLLFHPMENMMQLFLIAISAGILVISAGLLFNVVNGIIAGETGEALFGTRGISGLAVYLSVIYFVMRYIFSGMLPASGELLIFLAPPAVLFALRGPLEFILFHGEEIFPHGLFEYIVESLVELIEMFSGLLGNTISFIRAGAFALSHAGLSIAVFTLAGIIDPEVKSIGAITAIVIGNIFIILLEGLVCSIQSMRLEYYEFFSKFFKGDGIAFNPFRLSAGR